MKIKLFGYKVWGLDLPKVVIDKHMTAKRVVNYNGHQAFLVDWSYGRLTISSLVYMRDSMFGVLALLERQAFE